MLRQLDCYAVDLGELDPKQTPFDAYAGLTRFFTFLVGEELRDRYRQS